MAISDKASNSIAIFQAIGWIGAVASCMLDFAWAWMFVVGFMAFTLCLNGCRSNGRVNKKLLIYPLTAWLVIYLISVAGMVYYHLHFGESAPTFYILGQHPSGFFMHIVYWIGGILTISLGLVITSDSWCSDKQWDDYVKLIGKESETA